MMQRAVQICVVGSANVDLTFRTARLPRPGETLTGRDFQLGFGGKGANQAVTAARLGATVSFVARVGNDTFGQEYLRCLRAEGIDVAHVQTDPDSPTGTAAIVVDDEARNCILVIPGANGSLTAEHVRSALAALAADVVVAQLEVPLDAVLAAFRAAKSAGARTILNPAPALELPDELLRLTDVCIPNDTEIEIMTGQRVAGVDQAMTAARMLQERGARAVIVTLGERGALVLEGSDAIHLPAIQVNAVDTTGAGDAFIGSLAAFWREGLSLLEAAHRANAVAALAVTRPGAQTALPTRAEAEAFLAASR